VRTTRAEIRDFVVAAVSRTGGTSVRTSVSSSSHSPCTGLQLPEDILLFDTGHQAYIHKILTGAVTASSPEAGRWLSGYPSRASPSMTGSRTPMHRRLSVMRTYATALSLEDKDDSTGGARHVVAVVGDGALTGGMAYEALTTSAIPEPECWSC